MHKHPLDPSKDLDIQFLQPAVTEKMVNEHWNAILLQLGEDNSANPKNNGTEIKDDSQANNPNGLNPL